MSTKYNRNKKSNKTSYLNIIPIIIALSIVPLIMRLKFIDYPLEKLTWLTNEANISNLYTYYKGIVLMIAAVIGAIISLYNFLKHKLKINNLKCFYFLYAYIGLVILSWVFTTDRFFSTVGYPDHHENIFVLISYILIFIYTVLFLKTEQEFKTVISFWIGSIFILFVIGLTQLFGHDILFADFFKPFIIPAKYLSSVNFKLNVVTAQSVIYQTLFHYNYVSFYTALAFPFFLVLFFLDKIRTHRVVYLILCGIMIFNLIGSTSRNGLIGIVASLVIITLFLSKSFFKHWKLFVGVMVAGFFLFVIINISANTVLAQKFDQLFTQLDTNEDYPLNSITTLPDKTIINHDNYYLELKYEYVEGGIPFTFYNEAGEKLNFSQIGETYSLTTPTGDPMEKYNNLQLGFNMYQDSPTALLYIDGVKWYFSYVNDAFYYINALGNYETLLDVPTLGFEGKERLGSARGYIWSRTLPLLKDYWLFGSGPDTFPLVFPQIDHVGKYNAYQEMGMVVDKPHNFLLDYAVSTGVPSLLVLLIFWGIYIVWCFRLYLKSNFSSFYAQIGMASFASVIGYLSAALFNDTNVNITPLFWVILGIGFAANTKYSLEIKNTPILK